MNSFSVSFKPGFITALAFLLLSAASAQNNNLEKKIAFGIQVGYGVSNASPDHAVTYKSAPLYGLNAGIFTEIWNNCRLSFKPTLSYAAIGSKIPYDGRFVATKRLKYIDLSLIAHYKLDKDAFSVFAGPQVGKLLSARASVNDGRKDWGIEDNFKHGNISGLIGIAIEPANSHFGFSVRYQRGFTIIEENGRHTISAFTAFAQYKF